MLVVPETKGPYGALISNSVAISQVQTQTEAALSPRIWDSASRWSDYLPPSFRRYQLRWQRQQGVRNLPKIFYAAANSR